MDGTWALFWPVLAVAAGAAFYLMPVRVRLYGGGGEAQKERLYLRLEALWGLWAGDYTVVLTEEGLVHSWPRGLSLPPDWDKQLGRVIRGGEEYGELLATVTRRAHCQRLRMDVRLGGNPALVGMAAGLVHAMEGAAFPLLRQRLRFAPGEPRFTVRALYGRESLDLSFDCILVARGGEIIRAIWLGMAK